jgi:serine/threonine protein kinase/Tfp pilus assembly protein PilF
MNWAFTAEENFAEALRYGHFEIELDEDGLPITLGAGAMAMTYRARDTVLNSLVALKVIGRNLVENPVARTRFLREARAAAQIHHPNVARVIHYGEQGDECFYAMELVEGETLEARVQRTGPLPVSQALEVIEQATRALIAAEACGVVHRDIKPSNVMVESDPSGALFVKIIDYGVAKILSAEVDPLEQTQTGFLGTPAFASPEQFAASANANVDVRSDIYSLGTTFWYLLTGRAPFAARSIEEIKASHNKLSIERLKAAHVPSPIIELLKRMLAIDPAKRPQSPRELLEEVHRAYLRFEPRAKLRRKHAWLGAAAAAIVVALGVTGYYFYERAQVAAREERSIAVLPFENLSGDPDNAYFADGIQDEILTRLSKIADLKVISRASTQRYKSAPKNLPEIAKQLGVANILEGSVQKSGETVRVNVQLIKAADDSHLWADIFDRRLTDILSVESEVSKAIADQLRVKLTGREEQVIEAKLTDVPEAYDAYLRGLALSVKAAFTPANFLSARNYLKEAVRLDPKFALAWARLSYIDSRNYLGGAPTVSLREEAREAAETALALQPNLGEAVHAKGYYHYACLRDYDTAARYFEQARSLLPNSSQIPESLAYLERRRGHWDRSESYFAEAERLDPRNVPLLTQHALSFIDLHRFPEASRKLDQVLDITPDDIFPLVIKSVVAQAEGDLPRAAALLAPLPLDAGHIVAVETQVYQAILERNPASIIPQLKELLAKPEPDPASNYTTGELRFWLGWAQEVAGQHDAAQESWRLARSELEHYLKEHPENWQNIGHLALTNMGLGDKSTALALVDKAMAAVPIEKDALDGPAPIEILARICAQMGEPDRAIAALEKVLPFPYEGPLAGGVPPLTPAILRFDPMFDPLRNDPRFQALLNSPPPARH